MELTKVLDSATRRARIAAFNRGPGLVNALRDSIAFAKWRRVHGGSVADWRAWVARQVAGRNAR